MRAVNQPINQHQGSTELLHLIKLSLCLRGLNMLNLFTPTFSRVAAKGLANVAALLAVTMSGSALAQIYNGYQDSNDSLNDYVTIYQDCDYRGKSRVIAAGNYRNMGEIEFGNDSVSSIRVPSGFEVTIYEDDRFGGTYARIGRDISCFDEQWNDEVSSIQVTGTGLRPRENDQRNEPYRGGDRDDNRNNNNLDGNKGDSTVTAKNVTRVVFESRVLQQVNQQQWKIADARYGVSQYRETSRDSSAVYLQNDYTDERIRIDLFANDVTFVSGDGRTQRYAIQRKQSTLTPAPTSSPDTETYQVGNNGCFRYKAYTRGGQGGLRFHGKKGFTRFSKKAHTGRICHTGTLTMEIDKTAPSTDVIVEIQGRKIRFSANETPTAYKNEWYRKHVTLNVQSRR